MENQNLYPEQKMESDLLIANSLKRYDNGSFMVQQMWEILVPTIRNDGKPYKTRHHREWDKQVRQITGGLTILTPAKGQWVNPGDGTLFVERMIPVRIVCTSEQINEIIRRTFNHYPDQIAVLAYKVSDEVRLIQRDVD